MKNSNSLFKYLKGTWKIERHINNKNEPYFNGLAYGRVSILEEQKNILLYKENLELQLNNSIIKAHKEYNYILEHNKLSLYNNIDGKASFMFNIEFNNQQIATGNYKCEQDHYNATYCFAGANKFTIKFDVTGPEKNYSITSIFSRDNDISTLKLGEGIFEN